MNIERDYIIGVSNKAKALLGVEFKGRKFEDFGSYWFSQIGLDGAAWLERMEQLKDASFEWPIPYDVATYELLEKAGLIK